jgi:hypothetical protein
VEPLGPVKACNGIALPLPLSFTIVSEEFDVCVNMKALDYSESRQILDKLHIVTSYEILYLRHLLKSK